MSDERFSPASACIYSFEFADDAKAGDIILVNALSLTRLDLYYAQGINYQEAKGRQIENPRSANFTVHYPNKLYLTFLNKDTWKTDLESPYLINFFLQKGAEGAELITELVQPVIDVPETPPIPVTRDRSISDGDETMNILLWVAFTLTLIAFCVAGSVYFYMRRRKKKMQLQ